MPVRPRLVLLVVVTALTTAGCGGLKVAAGGADEAARAFGVGSQTVELTGNDVTRLAVQAQGSEDVVGSVAPRVDEQPPWRAVLNDLEAVNRITEGRVRDVSLRLACDVLNDKIQSEDQLWGALTEQLVGLSNSQLRAAYSITV